MDEDQTGMISVEELEHAMRNSNFTIAGDAIKEILKNVDYAGNGRINYTEFLAATVSIKSVLTYDKLWALFKHFDTDDSGVIT